MDRLFILQLINFSEEILGDIARVQFPNHMMKEIYDSGVPIAKKITEFAEKVRTIEKIQGVLDIYESGILGPLLCGKSKDTFGVITFIGGTTSGISGDIRQTYISTYSRPTLVKFLTIILEELTYMRNSYEQLNWSSVIETEQVRIVRQNGKLFVGESYIYLSEDYEGFIRDILELLDDPTTWSVSIDELIEYREAEYEGMSNELQNKVKKQIYEFVRKINKNVANYGIPKLMDVQNKSIRFLNGKRLEIVSTPKITENNRLL